MLYIVEEHVYIYSKLGVAVRCVASSSIKNSYEIIVCESLSLSHVCLIEDRVLRFCNVVREEEMTRNACRLIFIARSGCVYVSIGVHQVLLILVFRTPQMNG